MGEAERTQQERRGLGKENSPQRHRGTEEGTEGGLDALREAMSLGREHGIVNCFGWRPDVMPRLCVKALEAGIEVKYVQHLVRRRNLIPETPPLECENWPWPVGIFTLGHFGILKDEQPLEYSRKAQQRPLLMLKALIAIGGREVAEEQLSDLLWPEADGDAAHKSFEVTLLRLRRLMGHPDAIQLREGLLTLDQRYCCVDAWAFERMAERIEMPWKDISPDGLGEAARTQRKKVRQDRQDRGGMDKLRLSVPPATEGHAGNSCPSPARSSSPSIPLQRGTDTCPPPAWVQRVDGNSDGCASLNPSNKPSASGHGQTEFVHATRSASAEAARLAEKAIGLYKGHFLPADTGYPWTAAYRERLRDKFRRLVVRLSQFREDAGHYENAVECLRKGVEIDNLAEEFYQRLMVCYQRLGQEAEAVRVYQRCRAVFSAALGIAPSARTEAIYNALIPKHRKLQL